jgi:hypothetical protein
MTATAQACLLIAGWITCAAALAAGIAALTHWSRMRGVAVDTAAAADMPPLDRPHEQIIAEFEADLDRDDDPTGVAARIAYARLVDTTPRPTRRDLAR